MEKNVKSNKTASLGGLIKNWIEKTKTRMRRGMDIPLLTIVLLLLVFGLVMLFSASYPSGYMRRGDSFSFIREQIKFALIGLAAMFAVSLIDYRDFRKFAWPAMMVAIVLLCLVLLMAEKNGAKRWIWLNAGQTRGFQPSEVAKFALILVFAKMIAVNQKYMKTFEYGFLPFIMVLAVISGLLILEPHLSCTLLVLGIGVSMMFAGGTSIRYFLVAGALVLILFYFVVSTGAVPYAMERINTWKDPFSVPPSDGYQIIQSLIAVGSGGPTGRGIGKSVQKFLYLPEVYNDYIYAIICEELGLIGGIGVMFLFFLLLARGVYIALRIKDKFGSMLIIGISVQIALQAFLHVAVNLNAIPSTGISLPFFSYGGTSLCMILGQVGVMLSVSRGANLEFDPKPGKEKDLPGNTTSENEEKEAGKNLELLPKKEFKREAA